MKAYRNQSKKELILLLENRAELIKKKDMDVEFLKFGINNMQLRLKGLSIQIKRISEHPYARDLTRQKKGEMK